MRTHWKGDITRRILILALAAASALVSLAGLLVLTRMVAAGERRIAGSQRQLETGQAALEAGKARLDSGKRELAQSKKEYNQAGDNPFSVLADKLLRNGKGFKEAGKQIAAGDTQVAVGEGKVNAGERQLGAGELELRQGRKQLRLARRARVACALGVALFASLSALLAFVWKRRPVRSSVHADA